MTKRILAILYFIFLGFGSAFGATVNTCEKEWDEVLTSKSLSSYDSKIEYWKSKSKLCSKTGIYEFRVGHLYTMSGQLSKAESAFNKGLSYKTGYRKELLSGLASLYLKKRDWTSAESLNNSIITEYPQWYDGYQGLGTVKLIQGKFKEAIDLLNKSNQLTPSAVSYRHLTIAYNQVGDHTNAAKSINAAFEMDSKIQSDRDPMLAAAISYARLGKYKVADGLLAMLLKARPEVQNDKEFLNIAAFVSKKLQVAQQAK